MKKAYINYCGGKYFPISLKFAINSIKYGLVFETVDQAINYFACLYGINKRDYHKVFVIDDKAIQYELKH